MPANQVAPAPAVTAPEASFALEGDIPRRRLPLSYRIGLAISAVAMVLLPLLYLGVIGVAVYGVYLYARYAVVIFQGGDNALLRLVVYLGPIVAGVILIAFLVKPLFASATRVQAPATLDLDQQPRLRALIATVCAKVGAPMPVRVDVDCQVNASARLRRGLLSLGRNDLVLTVGLPLVGGLTARQLAGVLAHEFGHFAQGAGMGTTYVIRTINGWFARVVFERDSWDETLVDWSRRLDFRIRLILGLARAGIWVSRRLLHGLMYVGHAIACWQMRQMEYDADYYAIHVSGTEDFIATSRELLRMGYAGQVGFGELRELWRDRRLVDDFPGYVVQRRADLARQIEPRMTDLEADEKTRWSDTHPSRTQRNAAAQSMNQRGLFQGEFPAVALFHQFEELCREATSHYYREGLDLPFDAASLIPSAVAARPGREAAEAVRAREELFGAVPTLDRPVLWTATDFATAPSTHDPAALAAQFAGLRAEFARLLESATSENAGFCRIRDDLVQARVARQFFGAKINADPALFGLTAADVGMAEARIAELAGQIATVPAALAAYDQLVHRWGVLVAGTRRLYGESLPADIVAEIDRIVRRLVDFRPWFRAYPAWAGEQRFFVFALRHEQALGAQRNYTLLGAHVEKMRSLAANAPKMVDGLAWPLAPEHAPRSVPQQLARTLEHVAPAHHLAVLLESIAELYFDSLGRLVVCGHRLEKILTESELA